MGNGQSNDTVSRRLRNRIPFSKAVAQWREELARPGFVSTGAEHRATVVLRKRPLHAHEIENDFDVVTCQGDGQLAAAWVSMAMTRMNGTSMFLENNAYAFDAAWDERSSTDEIYHAHVSPLVALAKNGGNTCVLMFGQTGSGKTHTMSGFLKLVAEELADEPLSVSMLEVSKDVADLVNGGLCNVREDAEGRVHIVAATKDGCNPEVSVVGGKAALDVLLAAASSRATAITKENQGGSSRSHALYQLRTATGMLQLVDLAGTEWAKDQAEHSALRAAEAKQINSSLSVLKACLRAREENDSRVPVREHKLTRLLQKALQGDARILLVATVSPSSANTEHTMDTMSNCSIKVDTLVGQGSKGQLVVTRSLRGIVADSEGRESQPKLQGVRGWSPEDVCEWWIDAADEAVEAAKSVSAHMVHIKLLASDWPAGQKLGLTLEPGSTVVSKVARHLSLACQFVKSGCRLISVQGIEGTDADVLAALRSAAGELAGAASVLAELKALRESINLERENLSEPLENSMTDINLDAALLAKAAAAADVALHFVFAEPRGNRVEACQPPIPRLFTGESRKGDSNGEGFALEFGDVASGLGVFTAHCGCPAVARHMYSALRQLLDAEEAAAAAQTAAEVGGGRD